ncbi:SIR2 family protein [Oribacterium sp.]
MAIDDDSIDRVEIFKVALQSGINLFTGAGFSKLPDAEGNLLPDANELCPQICERFVIDARYKNDLEKLSNIVNLRHKDAFQKYLREKFTVSSYNHQYDILDRINLHSYITTNIDNIIQCVMDSSKRYSLFNISEYGAKRNASSLPFIPLHGNVKYLNSHLYFGKNELANVDSDNKDLFDLMHAKLLEVPTLFIGYGFHDNAVERTISNLLQEGNQDVWVQCMPNSDNIDYFRDIGCHVIVGTTEELLKWIDLNIPNQEKISNNINIDSLRPYAIPTINKLEVVQREDYYTKGYTHWYCILSDYAYQTKNVNALYEAVLKNKNIIAVGIPFSGKTTLMMQIAAKAQAEYKLILSNISVEEAQRIINLLGESKALVFVDNCCDDITVVKLLMQQSNFMVLGFADDYAFESTKHLLEGVSVKRKDIGELTREEAQGIFNKIPVNFRKQEDLSYKDSEDEKFSILEFASQNIKNILTSNRVKDLLKRVNETSKETFDIIALSTYLTCNKSCLNVDVLCAFENTTNYIILREYVKATQGYLSEINVPLSQDSDNQDYYELRSNLFARLAYDVLQSYFKEEFSAVVRKLILSVSPYNIYQYHVFRRSAFDGKLFSDLFGDDAYSLYERIFQFDSGAYTLQQRALYKSHRCDFKGAFEDIDKAISINGSNFSIKNSHAIILFEANKNKRTSISEESIAEAMDTLRKCFSSDKRKVYHAQKFAEFAVYLAKNWRDSSYLEEAEKWLVQLIGTQESTSSFTKYLLRQVHSELSKIK